MVGLDAEWQPGVKHAPVSIVQLAMPDATVYVVDVLTLAAQGDASAAALEGLFALLFGGGTHAPVVVGYGE
jgi:hypothetical protein